MVIGVDDSEESTNALEWALDHFFAPYAPNFHFDLVVVHAKPSPISLVGIGGPGTYMLSSIPYPNNYSSLASYDYLFFEELKNEPNDSKVDCFLKD